MATVQRTSGVWFVFFRCGRKCALCKWVGVRVGVVGCVYVVLTSLQGRQRFGCGRDAWSEVQKVVWPTRKESIQMTAYVFGFVVIMALFLWLTDKTLEWVFYDLILGWKK